MWLFVGLGNPGKEYAHHRHNIGFMAVDEIVRRHNFSDGGKKFQSQVATGTLNGEKVLVLKPQTYMNLSGDAVQAAAAFYKLELDRIVVFHDELDLAPGKLRIKRGGGAGGHNGLRSIDAHAGADYWRVRLGIGHPGNKDLVSDYVLGNFARADAIWLEAFIGAVALHAGKIVAGDTGGFMTAVARDAPPPKEQEEEEKNGI